MEINNISHRKFMVTGATGRLGCEIVLRLEELGASVFPLVLPGYYSTPKRIVWNCKTKPIFVNDQSDLHNLPVPDYLINLHWKVNRSLSFSHQLLYELDCNIHRLEFLWNWLKGKSLKRFINLSSTKVFSHLNTNPIRASSEPRPVSPYGIAKKAAENFFDAVLCKSIFPVVHLRLCSVASYGEHPSQLFSQLILSALNRQKIKINVGHYSNILYIDDAIDLIINAALEAKKRFYILAPERIKNDTIADVFKRITNSELNADYIDLIPGIEDPLFINDIQKLSAGWIRKTTLDKMIQKLISKYDNQTLCANTL